MTWLSFAEIRATQPIHLTGVENVLRHQHVAGLPGSMDILLYLHLNSVPVFHGEIHVWGRFALEQGSLHLGHSEQ